MPYQNPKHKTRHQRQQRRTKQVRRVEIVLSADSERDHEINDFLDSLPRGEAAEFIRTAIIEKIARSGHQEDASPPQTEAPAATRQLETLYQNLADENRRANAQLEALYRELAALREAVNKRAPVAAAIPAEQPVQAAPPAPTGEELTASSGLDMSAPRPRKTLTRTPAPPPTLPEEKPFDEATARRMLIDSINNFGKNRAGR
jgi:hypothetical protein